MRKQQVTEKEDISRRRRKKRARARLRRLIAAVSVVAVIALALLIDSTLYYNKVHAGVSVSGVSLGGLTRDEAASALDRYVQSAEKSSITLVSGENKWTLLPKDVGITIDVPQAVAAAMDITRKSNFFADVARRFKLYFSGTELPLKGTVDADLVDKFIEHIAEQLDMPPVNSGLAISNGEIRIVDGRKGNVVDQAKLREQLETLLFTLHSTEIQIPMVVKDPSVQAAHSQEAIDQVRAMITAPVTLNSDTASWTLNTDQIEAYMDFTSKDQNGTSVLVPYLSADKMKSFFDQIREVVAVPAADATWTSDGQKAWVVPAVPGKELDTEATAAALTAVALQSSGRTADIVVHDTQPELTTEKAQAYGITDRLGTYATEYVGTDDRQHNVKLTTKYVTANGLLAPGEEFNFDERIGPRTEDRGYRQAKGITRAGKLEDVLGGGICQVSTTLFNAVARAGLKVKERWNHSLYINHYPPGMDATVTEGSKNLRFVNDTEHYILIRGTSDGITTKFTIYGTKDGRSAKLTFSGFKLGEEKSTTTVTDPTLGPGTTKINIPGQQARWCNVKRIVTYADHTTKTDIWYSEYLMIPEEIAVGPGTSTTLPGGSTTKPGSTTTVATSF